MEYKTKCMELFTDDIRKAGYSQTKNLFRIRWSAVVDYTLLGKIISYNLTDKTDCRSFWRK